MEEKDKQMEDVVDSAETTEEHENERLVEERREIKPDRTRESAPVMDEEQFAPLFENQDAEKFRSHWLDIQSTFVDDPRESVKKADALVEDVIQSIMQTFAQKRTSLEDQWHSGDNVSTEDLRLAIKRYRSFFNRLLSLES